MDGYFEQMLLIEESGNIPNRIRYMLGDVRDLRDNKWVPKRR